MMASTPSISLEEKSSAHAKYLALEMARLRLLIRRRLLWLHQRWRTDAAPGRVGWAITEQEAEMLLEGEDLQEQLRFYQSDDTVLELSRTLDELELHIELHRREMEEARTPCRLDILSSQFGLAAFERDVLLLCLAPELDTAIERLYAYVQDDAARRYATPHLALTVLVAGGSEIERASFFPGAPLMRWRLLAAETHTGLLSSPLRIDQRIANFLLGMNPLDTLDQIDPQNPGVLTRAPHLPLPSCHREQIVTLAHWLLFAGNRSKGINLVGPPGSGRLAMSQAICEEAGLHLLVIDPRLLPPTGGERQASITIIGREAVLSGSGLFLDLDLMKQDEARSLLTRMRSLDVPLLLASTERFPCEHEILCTIVSRPDAASQNQIWMQVLGPSAERLRGHVEEIVEQFDLGPGAIVGAARLAEDYAALRGPGGGDVSGEDLWQACRQQSGPRMGLLAHKVSSSYSWDDIVVPADVLSQLQEMTAQVAHRHHVYQHWGFGSKLSRGRGIGALFSGPSGVGKTMAAEVIAQQLHLDLYRIDLAGVMSKYIGEAEKNLCSIFDAAERSGAILFFDEADALFGKRTEIKDSHDRYANIEINYLLQRMEDYRGLAILATNMKAALDSAFTRRLRFIIDFPLPDTSQRMELWRRVFPPAASVENLDYRALSKCEITGANIRNIAVNAAFLAAAQGVPIRMEHVIKAAKREYAKMGRLIMDAEFGGYTGVSVQ